MSRPRVIAFTGKMGAGKTTAMEYMQYVLDDLGATNMELKFAGKLYELQTVIYNTLGRKVEGAKDRELLQFIGTEWGRKKFGPSIWVDLWKERVEQFPRSVVIVNDDCRFDNEAETVREMGGIIVEIVASEETRAARIPLINTGHSSENGISANLVTYQIDNNGTDAELRNQIEELVRRLGYGAWEEQSDSSNQ